MHSAFFEVTIRLVSDTLVKIPKNECIGLRRDHVLNFGIVGIDL